MGAHAYYEEYWQRGWTTEPPLKLVELFEAYVDSTALCLEVGCGDGGTSGVWLQAHAASYVGVDISEAALRIARERGLDVRLIDDAVDLPFRDDSFDVAVSTEVLEHLFEPQRVLEALRRVVRPQGLLIITVPNAAHWRNRLDLALLGRWNPRGDQLSGREPWRDPHIRFFTQRSLRNLVERCGFEIVARGGHDEHAFLSYVPGLRRWAPVGTAGRLGRRVASTFPALLAGSIHLVARVP